MRLAISWARRMNRPRVFVAVAVGVGLLVAFWNKIREWLTGVVANFISTANYTKEELDEIDKNVVLTQTFVQQPQS